MKLLLHICCGPCAVYPVDVLRVEGIEPVGYFYNPNIHPIDEHKKRAENAKKFSEKSGLEVFFDDEFLQDEWEDFVGEKDARCAMCYAKRLEKVAAIAAARGFDAFTTTLLVSPYQNHDKIIEIANKISEKNNIKFLYRDFRPGFRQGQAGAKKMELYRQKYCGCILSL